MAKLSPREVAVLRAATYGETVEQTGARMAISPNTVKTHQKNVMEKLGAAKFVQAVALAYEEGILPTGDVVHLVEKRLGMVEDLLGEVKAQLERMAELEVVKGGRDG